MCCSDPPPPPDMGPMAEASEEVARISQETMMAQLEWAREQDTMNREVLQQVLDIQLPAMQEQFGQAQSDRKRYEEVFRPMEDEFAREAQEYDTPERRMQERGAAIADINTQFDAQRRNALQRLEGYGSDPSIVRNAALDVGIRTQQAMAQAAAATGANRRVEDTGRALRSDVINMGRGALSNAAGFYGQSVGAGSQAVAGGAQTTQTGAGAIQSAMGWGGQALSGYGQSGNLQNMGYGNQLSAYNAKQAQTAGLMQGIGGMVGLGMAADGGEVPDDIFDEDGLTYGPGDGSGVDDQIPAMLSQDEYVIPADVVRAKGTEFFDRLVDKYHTPAEEQRRANA